MVLSSFVIFRELLFLKSEFVMFSVVVGEAVDVVLLDFAGEAEAAGLEDLLELDDGVEGVVDGRAGAAGLGPKERVRTEKILLEGRTV